MKIGKLAQKSGVSIDTIRFYERREILPQPERLPSGYRIYSDAAYHRIVMVKSLQALGFTLDEIIINLKDLDEEKLDCVNGEKPMQVVLERVERRIADLMKVRKNIQSTLADCRTGDCRFIDG